MDFACFGKSSNFEKMAPVMVLEHKKVDRKISFLRKKYSQNTVASRKHFSIFRIDDKNNFLQNFRDFTFSS